MNFLQSSNADLLKPLVISRAPLLISFAAGAHVPQDLSRSYGSQVLNIAIGYHVYTIITPSRIKGVQLIVDGYQVLSSDVDQGRDAWARELKLSQAIARHFGVRGGTRIFIAPQLVHAVGLGLVGSIGVALIKGLAYACGVDLEPQAVVDLACHIATTEHILAPETLSQYASAFGGIGLSSTHNDRLTYEQIQMSRQTYRGLEKGLMLFSTREEPGSVSVGGVHQDDILRSLPECPVPEDQMRSASGIRWTALEAGDLESIGYLLHLQWLADQQIDTPDSDGFLARCYDVARQYGATGGLSSSVSGCHCLILYCREQYQRAVSYALAGLGWQQWPLTLAPQGVQLLEALPWQRQSLSSVAAWQGFSDSDSAKADTPLSKSKYG